MFSQLAYLAILPAVVYATVYTTSPIESTTFTGGQEATISWQDSGDAPTLEGFGDAKVSIYVGNALQQTSLQLIVDSVNVATTQSIQFTPDPSIGPDSNEYFVRFESLALKDAENPQYPALAFSAKFNMVGMSGSFDATVQAQIDGQSTAPISGPTATGTGATSATTNTRAATSSSSSSSTRTATGSTVSTTDDPNAASRFAGQWSLSILTSILGLAFLA